MEFYSLSLVFYLLKHGPSVGVSTVELNSNIVFTNEKLEGPCFSCLTNSFTTGTLYTVVANYLLVYHVPKTKYGWHTESRKLP